MKKIVLSSSSSSQKDINKLINEIKDNYEILNYPKPINKQHLKEIYPSVHKLFYKNITETNILLLANFDKNGIKGYIGPAGFAELSFGLSQNLLYNKKIELFILQKPDKQVSCYDEINLWLSLGWVKVWNNKIE